MRGEKAEVARALRDEGMTIAEIAEIMQYERSYVGKLIRGHSASDVREAAMAYRRAEERLQIRRKRLVEAVGGAVARGANHAELAAVSGLKRSAVTKYAEEARSLDRPVPHC